MLETSSQRRAASVGFDWPDLAGSRGKVTEEIAELDEAIASGDGAAIEEELGERTVGFRIEDEDLEDLKTVRDAVDYVWERVKGQ